MTRLTPTGSIFLTLVLLLPQPATADDDVVEGLPIVIITFDRFDIFDTSDPKTGAWFYRWANALHIVSKEDFLRSMLLFEVGDTYSKSKAAESAKKVFPLPAGPVRMTISIWVSNKACSAIA